MTIITTLAKVKAVSQSDLFIQTLNEADPVVTDVFALVDVMISGSKFGSFTESAQTYLAAHLLSLAKTVAGGQGPLSSESIGGVVTSYTLPYLNQVSVIASTQYGLMYLELQKRITVPVLVI